MIHTEWSKRTSVRQENPYLWQNLDRKIIQKALLDLPFPPSALVIVFTTVSK
jgi:hypothetical protein